jgi:hypothetical protein
MCIECHPGFGETEVRALAERFGFLPPRQLSGIWLMARPESKALTVGPRAQPESGGEDVRLTPVSSGFQQCKKWPFHRGLCFLLYFAVSGGIFFDVGTAVGSRTSWQKAPHV